LRNKDQNLASIRINLNNPALIQTYPAHLARSIYVCSSV